MKCLIITVAGMSSRFNKDTKEKVLKCLYYEDTPANSLLSLQVGSVYDLVDEIIVVGGYKYGELERFIYHQLPDTNRKIKIVLNDHYSDYGSCYSLLKGIEAVSGRTDEIIFIEGDLFFDKESIVKIIASTKDVISINREPILSNKAVALYFDSGDHPHYIYDTSHSFLEIKEPFTAIYNSAQMWKFTNATKVRVICNSLCQKQKEGTNLEIIQRYYGDLTEGEIEIVQVNKWFNCNTVADYKQAIQALI